MKILMYAYLFYVGRYIFQHFMKFPLSEINQHFIILIFLKVNESIRIRIIIKVTKEILAQGMCLRDRIYYIM